MQPLNRSRGMHAKTVVQKALIYGLGQGASKVIQLLTLPLFTRYLATTEYGHLSLLVLFGLMVRSLFGLGIGAAIGIVYFRKETDKHRSATIWTATGLMVISATSMVALSSAFAPLLTRLVLGKTTDVSVALPLYCASLALQMVADPPWLRLQFAGKAVQYVVIALLSNLVGTSASLVLVMSGRGLDGWVVGGLLGAAVTLLACIVMLWRDGRPAWNIHLARSLLRCGLPLIPGTIVLFLLLNSGPFFLKTLASVEAAGVYGVGAQLGMGMGMLTGAISTAWVPFFLNYSTRASEGGKIFPSLVTQYVLGCGLVALLFFACAKPAIFLLTPPPFHDAYKVIGVIALANFFSGLWSMLLPGMYFAEETQYVTLVQTISAGIAVAAQVLLIPRLGIQGAALAVALGMGSMVVIQIALHRFRNYGVPACDPARLLRAMAWLLGLALLQRLIDQYSGLMFSGNFLVVIVYGAGGWLLLRAEFHPSPARYDTTR